SRAKARRKRAPWRPPRRRSAPRNSHPPTAGPPRRPTGAGLRRRGGPAQSSVGGLAALGAPANVVAPQPQTAAAYLAASKRPGPSGYILIADRGNTRVLVVNPEKQIVYLYPNREDLARGRRLFFND